MATITDLQLTELKAKYLPSDAAANGWDDVVIADRWTGGFASTARQYWLERVQDTARYLDIPDPSGTLPITQLHRQAKEMLDYWDGWVFKYGDTGTFSRAVSFGKIRRRYQNRYPAVSPAPSYYGPYGYS
jgi:hypothetical protein